MIYVVIYLLVNLLSFMLTFFIFLIFIVSPSQFEDHKDVRVRLTLSTDISVLCDFETCKAMACIET